MLKFAELLLNIRQKIEIAELCKGVHCEDLCESFQTHIFLQHSASLQARTSPAKLAASRRSRKLEGPLRRCRPQLGSFAPPRRGGQAVGKGGKKKAMYDYDVRTRTPGIQLDLELRSVTVHLGLGTLAPPNESSCPADWVHVYRRLLDTCYF